MEFEERLDKMIEKNPPNTITEMETLVLQALEDVGSEPPFEEVMERAEQEWQKFSEKNQE
jgi:hypothetical protein